MEDLKTYKIKKLIDGYKIGLEFRNKTLVAIPDKKFIRGKAYIKHNDDVMFVRKEDAIHQEEFEDRYGRDEKYCLFYYFWNPRRQLKLF